MFKYTVLLLILALLVSACAEQPEIDYVGNSYTPTTDVEIFVSADDIEEEYVEMGKAVAVSSTNISTQELQEALLEEAKRVGADAIIIGDTGRRLTGTTTITHNEDTGQDVIADQKEKWLEAIFIKYKKNL